MLPQKYQQPNSQMYGQNYQQQQNGYAKHDQIEVEIMVMEPQHPNSQNAHNANIAILYPSYKKETHSHYPQQICCPSCNKIITTMIKYEIGVGTWAMVLCFLCFFWPLMCLPFCCQSMKDVVHYCPACNQFCGRKKFLC